MKRSPKDSSQGPDATGKQVSGKRPKLLFLAYPFPPCPEVGRVRTWNIARHLSRLGWEVTVVAPDPSVWRHVNNLEETNAQIKRHGMQLILTGHSFRHLAPDSLRCRNQGLSWVIGGVCRTTVRRLGIDYGIGWIRAAESACSTLTSGSVDIILATGPPFAAFTLAKRLSDRLGCPYVLDYRDPWTGNPHTDPPVRPAIAAKEARLLAGCAAVTIVSPSWGMTMESRFSISSKLHVITNGYDAEELAR